MAIAADSTVGFVAVKLDSESRMGEIYMVAVDPDFQGNGIGTAQKWWRLNGLTDKSNSRYRRFTERLLAVRFGGFSS